MSDPRDGVGRALADVPMPDAPAAEQRARALVLDAFERREPAPPRRRRTGLRLALGVAGMVLLAGVAVASPGGDSVRQFVHDAVRQEVVRAPTAATAPFRLPGGGTLLVRGSRDVFVVHADGSRRLLGRYRDASWSPHARFVVATAGRQLVVLDPRSGATRWSITAASTVSGARWSLEATVPPCCRVAYLTGDGGVRKGTLHVIAGDGTGNRVLAPADSRVPPAWQPRSSDRAIAFVDVSGAIRLFSADTGRDLATPHSSQFRPTRLAWSADGTRLLAMSARRLLVLDARLRSVVRTLQAGAGGSLVSAAFVGRGHAAVVLRRLGAGRSRVELVPAHGPGRPLETLVGTLSGLAPSPDGRSVLIGWGAADQWLLVPIAAGPSRRLAGLERRFGTSAVPLDAAWSRRS